MSDIVEKLRSLEVFIMNGSEGSPVANEAAAYIERLEAALGQIERMKLFPEDKINRITLSAALSIARAALQTGGARRGIVAPFTTACRQPT